MLKVALASGLVLALAAPALASTLPGADDHQTTLAGGVGSELGLAVDGSIAPNTRLGFAVGTPTWALAPDYDLRLAEEFATGLHGFDMSFIGGVYGNGAAVPDGVELGVGMAFALTDRLELRANPVFGLGFAPAPVPLSWAPAAGVELGYRFTPVLEGTLGYDARGEILGLRFHL